MNENNELSIRIASIIQRIANIKTKSVKLQQAFRSNSIPNPGRSIVVPTLRSF